jgi:site-specific DNA-methyltransferase (adenine-specific)
LFGSEPFSSALRMSNIKQYKYDWIWEKNNWTGFFDSNVRPIKIHETISIFSHAGCSNGTSNKMVYYPQGLVAYWKKCWRWKHNENWTLNKAKINSYIQQYTNYPNSILKYKKEVWLHPTQKPVALIEYLIKTYTNEWETVLDFTAWSFTTAVACENTNRKWICIEKDEKYFKIGINRINNLVCTK